MQLPPLAALCLRPALLRLQAVGGLCLRRAGICNCYWGGGSGRTQGQGLCGNAPLVEGARGGRLRPSCIGLLLGSGAVAYSPWEALAVF